MLKIRLMKPGKSVKRKCHFKIVVMEARKARDSNFLEQIGYYDSSRKLFKLDLEKYENWRKKGAQPTETVASLARRHKKTLKTKSSE